MASTPQRGQTYTVPAGAYFVFGTHPAANPWQHISDLTISDFSLSTGPAPARCGCKAGLYDSTGTLDCQPLGEGCATGEGTQACTSCVDAIFNPPELSRAYSSVYNNEAVGTGHARSMLHGSQAWSAATSQVGEWMQIDAGSVLTVKGVVSQARGESWQRVTEYRVEASSDGSLWANMGTFPHSLAAGHQELVQNVFARPIEARWVKLFPLKWYVYSSMRAGLLILTTELDSKAGRCKCKTGTCDVDTSASALELKTAVASNNASLKVILRILSLLILCLQ